MEFLTIQRVLYPKLYPKIHSSSQKEVGGSTNKTETKNEPMPRSFILWTLANTSLGTVATWPDVRWISMLSTSVVQKILISFSGSQVFLHINRILFVSSNIFRIVHTEMVGKFLSYHEREIFSASCIKMLRT